ncbi:MAG: ABC transporter ATP-binding protein [Synergistaceae bacterium]|jgi:lipopolysaccharide transport system ATP-binding protein|nr:ABC transporter ATP-binding protein [Synergistaceae bacterium]
MPDTVIRVENLGKKYLISHQAPARYIALRDVLADRAKRLGQRLVHPFAPRTRATELEEFWALKDVSFEVQGGERVGIIGHNGAGKSTLLKILSRITEPTRGRVSLKGRISSLLEVGTGFHPELTGRENIFLNGAILGMTRAEILKNFDAIVDFAGVEQFLDTPVKHYSSGMYVRLAFAVAAHLDTEILLVDEVLAVGDAEFQKKCMGKMDEISHQEGRTILFVSHDMTAAQRLCNRLICLNRGSLTLNTTDVAGGVEYYLKGNDGQNSGAEWTNPGHLYPDPCFQPLRFGLYDEAGKAVTAAIERKDKITVEIEGIVKTTDWGLGVGYALYAEDGTLLYWSFQTDQMASPQELPLLEGHVCIRTELPSHLLNLGGYKAELGSFLQFRKWITQPGVNAPGVSFKVGGVTHSSPYCVAERPGVLALNIPWFLKSLP